MASGVDQMQARSRIRILAPLDVPGVGEDQPLEGDRSRIGRAKDCGIVVSSSSVSRYHAEVERLGSGYRLVDLGSTNGVWLRGERRREVVIRAGERFRLGEVELVILDERPELDDAPTMVLEIPQTEEDEGDVDGGGETTSITTLPGETRLAPTAPDGVAGAGGDSCLAIEPLPSIEEILAQEGELLKVGSNQPFLLGGTDNVWFVVSGKVDIFAVPVEGGEPKGRLSDFTPVIPGQCMFGMNVPPVERNASLLARGAMNTVLRRISVARMAELAGDPRVAGLLSALVETWVGEISRALARKTDLEPPDRSLGAGDEIALENARAVNASAGVLWLEIQRGNLQFIGMEEGLVLSPENEEAEAEGRSIVFNLADLLRLTNGEAAHEALLFPITPETWVQGANPDGPDSDIVARTTIDSLTSPALWKGLAAFHRTVCQILYQSMLIDEADEFVNLLDREENQAKAERDAYAQIAGVIESPSMEAPITTGGDPVFAACEMVGRAMKIRVVKHPDTDRRASFEDHVAAIAKASRFRTRVVALRADWWNRDQGPMLARMEKTKSPVALIPKSATSYQIYDPVRGTMTPVGPLEAAGLSPFGYSFYAPFPEGPVSAKTMLRFGAIGLKPDLVTLIAMGIGIGLLGTLAPMFTAKIFDTAIPEAERGLVYQFTLALFVATLASSAFKITQSIATLRIQGKMDYRLQAAVWDRLLDLPSTFFKDYAAGDLADRAAGIDAIRKLISGSGIGSILGSISSLFYIVLMFKYNVSLAFLAIGLTVLFVGVTTTANYLQLRPQRDKLRLQGRITGLVLQLVSGVGKLRVSGAENHAFRMWAADFSAQRRIEFRIGKIQNFAEVFNSGFPIISSMAIFAVLISLMRAKGAAAGMSTGEFIAFNAAYGAFQAAMQALSQASLDMLKVIPTYERLSPIITTEPEIDESKSYPGKLKGAIEISHVSFRYSQEGPLIVNDLSMKISPGEMVAFVGGSGCGKSTLMRLMLGFEVPEKGSIYYDSQDLASIDVRELRQQIGVVLQNSKLLPAELYRNIIGTSSLTIEDAWEAARLAGFAGDIEDMPMGMHTYVSEGGGGLSGGQRQRLLIARALARKPKVLFFDEATSALDNRSQAVVTESMEKLKATRIVIAHRLSTILNADRIYYLEAGRVAESGTYDELMGKDGLFAQLAKRQMA